MPYISREEFLARQKERQERAEAYQNAGPRVNYFGLKDDGDEAIVRFAVSTQDDVYSCIVPTHQTTVDGKFRRVRCLRENYKSPLSDCPMCAAGVAPSERLYIKLIEYTRDEDNHIVATPKVWERSTAYVTILSDYILEYGDLTDIVFKVKRSGKKGDIHTSYSIIPANQTIYNSSAYPKDFSGFDGYDVASGALLNWTVDQMNEHLGTKEDIDDSAPVVQQTAPRKVTY